MAHATIIAAIGVLPAFLTGALIVQLRNDLGVGVEQVGIATAALFITSALVARFGGGIVRALGASTAMVVAPLLSAVALLVAGAAPSFWLILVAMVLGGAANAIAQPVANQRLSDAVREERLGIAFGLKQASVPTATLFAGAAVPVVALAVGWRWVYFLAAACAIAVALASLRVRRRWAAPTPLRRAGGRRRDHLNTGAMVAFAIGGLLASTVGTSFGVFFVDAAVESHLSAASAGLVYACYSVVGIVVRILLGHLADRRHRLNTYVVIAALLLAGGVGFVLLVSSVDWQFVLGGLLAFTLGWAWPGLLHFAIVRDNMADPAAATSFLQSGSSFGAGAGPLLFGLLIGATSYETAWLLGAGVSVAAALVMLLGARAISAPE